jgi:hypothetical protein
MAHEREKSPVREEKRDAKNSRGPFAARKEQSKPGKDVSREKRTVFEKKGQPMNSIGKFNQSIGSFTPHERSFQ